MLQLETRSCGLTPSRIGTTPIQAHCINKQILIISGDRDLQDVIRTGLELTTAWEILSAYNPTEALDLAQTTQPQAVILNLEYRERERLKTIENFKSHTSTQEIPLILMCDRVRLGDWWRFSQLGITGLIAKPFEAIAIGEQIAGFLGWDVHDSHPLHQDAAS